MSRFLDDLRHGLRDCNVGHSRLLIAVSGGADSVALLRGLVDLAAEFSLELVVGHLNHRLREADSDDDAEWVKTLAGTLNLPCDIGNLAWDRLAVDSQIANSPSKEPAPLRSGLGGAGGLEETARNLRYRFLEDVAEKFECIAIALAHSADDQTETVLHHILRGTGISGLRGIPTVRTTHSGRQIVRPMLAIRRSEIEGYLRDCGQSFRTDATNVDTTMTRNRLRHVILPMLREQLNPQVDIAIRRLAEQAAEIDDFLRQTAGRLLEAAIRDARSDSCRIDVLALVNQPRPVVRELFRAIWIRQGWPRQAMGFEQWNRLVEIIQTRETITLPNRIEARFHSDTLLVLRCLELNDSGFPKPEST